MFLTNSKENRTIKDKQRRSEGRGSATQIENEAETEVVCTLVDLSAENGGLP